jgi:hypothetical protein
MIRAFTIIKIIILVGLTAFIVIGLLNLSRSITQTKLIKNIDNAKLGIMEKNNELQELQTDKKKLQEKSNQEIEDEPENNLEEEYITNRNGNEEINSVANKKVETYFLTYNEIRSLEKVSFRDKLFGIMLVGKIKSANLNRIWALAKGGITTTEANELKTILEKDLKKKDIIKIYNLLKRNMERLASK